MLSFNAIITPLLVFCYTFPCNALCHRGHIVITKHVTYSVFPDTPSCYWNPILCFKGVAHRGRGHIYIYEPAYKECILYKVRFIKSIICNVNVI